MENPKTNGPVTLDKIVALCKRRGFVYPSADIYGGLNGLYDFGPLGAALRENLKQAWRQNLTSARNPIVLMDGAIIGPQRMWEASGHVQSFTDPMVDCKNCKARFRADEPDFDINEPCPKCGKRDWSPVRNFNMMFKTFVGASEESSSVAYLRPETAQSIFVNFKNILSTYRIGIPFGIAQIGKAFRNEITPKQFLFRMREFEQMEMEWFCKPASACKDFEFWTESRMNFYLNLGITASKLRLRPHKKDELAHYSTNCSDVEYEFPFGWKELEGIANRGNYDLSRHAKYSGKDLNVFDEETKESFTPYVVECSVGVDRLLLVVLFDAYDEDKIGGEERVVLRLPASLAPVKVAVLPLVKKLSEPTDKLFHEVRKAIPSAQFDQTGSIGKRYRRFDEIGTPFCVTYDFDSLEDNAVTVRTRDTTNQSRVAIDKLVPYLMEHLGTQSPQFLLTTSTPE